MELGCRSTTEPRSPILISCSSAAAAKTVLSGLSPRRRWRVQRLRNLALLPSRRLKGSCLGAAEASWSFDPSRKNRSHAVKPRISTILGESSATLPLPGLWKGCPLYVQSQCQARRSLPTSRLPGLSRACSRSLPSLCPRIQYHRQRRHILWLHIPVHNKFLPIFRHVIRRQIRRRNLRPSLKRKQFHRHARAE